MAEDNYARYYAEKIWTLIPPIYRHEDGLLEGASPAPLRAVVEVIAEQAAVLRRSHDRLWEDQFAEQASIWAVNYIGDLVARRPISELDTRAIRADVAKTIYYRRRKGTPAILEELAVDIADWEGVVSESFRRLLRTPHRLDAPGHSEEAGTVNLRAPRTNELSGGPFDGFQYTPDIRAPEGTIGRLGISRLVFHLYRLRAVRVGPVAPRPVAGVDGAYTFDPSGRDVPLFAPRSRPHVSDDVNGTDDFSQWRGAKPWELPAPMSCHLLNHQEYRLTEAHIVALEGNNTIDHGQAEQLRALRNIKYSDKGKLLRALGALADGDSFTEDALLRPIMAYSLINDCSKSQLMEKAFRVDVDAQAAVMPEWATAALIGDGPPDVTETLAIDPARGRFLFLAGPPPGELTVSYHYGVPGPVGAGGFARTDITGGTATAQLSDGDPSAIENSGIAEFTDSLTYGQPNNRGAIMDLVVRATDQKRPYIRLEDDWRLGTGANSNSSLTLDGIWVGGADPNSLVILGDYETLVLRNVTLDPGGAQNADPASPDLPAVSLDIRGHVENLIIEKSILGPILVSNAGLVEEITIRDSILQAAALDQPAILTPKANLDVERTTVLGKATVHRLYSSDSLFCGELFSSDTQSGCFRYSATTEGSTAPHFFESHYIPADVNFFLSRRFGDPNFARLSQTAPSFLRTGAENGSELGAYSGLLEPIKHNNLRRKVEEYLPFGLLPVFVLET